MPLFPISLGIAEESLSILSSRICRFLNFVRDNENSRANLISSEEFYCHSSIDNICKQITFLFLEKDNAC